MILCTGIVPLLYEEPIKTLTKKQEVIENMFKHNYKQTVMCMYIYRTLLFIIYFSLFVLQDTVIENEMYSLLEGATLYVPTAVRTNTSY